MTKREYEILAEFRYELRKYLHFSEEAAHRHNLTPQKYQALLAVQGAPGRSEITIGELAEKLHIAAHSAVGLVDRLQHAGLIRREPSKVDRRRVLVKLTARGRAKLEKLASVHREALHSAAPLLAGLLVRLSPKAGGAAERSKRHRRSRAKVAAECGFDGERRPNASPVCYAAEEDF